MPSSTRTIPSSKSWGANFLRLAHYPHNDYALSKCDELGIIVQTEVPWVNNCGVKATTTYFDNIHQQMKEMITNLAQSSRHRLLGNGERVGHMGNNDKLQRPTLTAPR